MKSKSNFPESWSVEELQNADVAIIDGDRGKNYPNKEEFASEGFCLFLNTRNIKNDSFEFSSCDFITENKDNLLRKGKLKRNDVILTTRGTVGSVAFFHNGIGFENIRINSGMVILRCGKDIFPTYFYHLFKSNFLKQQIYLYSSGSAQPQLPIKDMKRMFIPLPKIETQKKIAAVLSAYDDLIENNKRRIALLEKMAEEIYREWFVRMRFPGYKETKFEGGIPVTWKKERFGNFCLLKRGYDLPDSKVEAGEFPVVASTSIKTYHNKFKVKPPVITTGRSGSLGTVLFTNTHAFPLNTTLYVKDFYGNSPCLIYYTLKNMKLENFNAGAGVPSLNRNHLMGLKLAIPNEELQKDFESKISKLFTFQQTLDSKNDTLVKTRDLLLSRLISGKLAVENLDIQFPPSMREEEMKAEVHQA